LVNSKKQRCQLHRGSGKNVLVPAAQAGQKYDFDAVIICSSYNSTLLSYTKMVKVVAPRHVFTTKKIHENALEGRDLLRSTLGSFQRSAGFAAEIGTKTA